MKRAILSFTCAGAGALAALLGLQFVAVRAESDRPLPTISVDSSPIRREGGFSSSFAPIIKQAAPSVVNIYTTKTVRDSGRGNPLFNDPMFREFFGGREAPRPRNRQQQNLGSGVIVSKDGYILTSNHVVEGADEVRIQTSAGVEMVAKIIGNDSATDTAVLKVEASDLPAITLADSDQLEVGDVVLAIGNPFGIGQTVTMGIISAMGRGSLGIVDYEDFIQTDASINPGNSGGALVDAQGRLIGVNTAILSRTGGNQGVGFAIPINMGRHVMESLIQNGRVSRGFLGVVLQSLTPELAREFNLPDTNGALIAGTEDGTPAAKAGMKPGDVVVEYNGKKVTDSRNLRLMVSQTRPKTEVSFKVLRDGETMDFKLELAELDPDLLAGRGSQPSTPASNWDNLEGVQVADLDKEGRTAYEIPNHIRGALVTGVDPDSNSHEAGLREGDVILEINRRPVRGSDEAVKMSETLEGNRVLLRVWSKGSSRYLTVNNTKREKADREE